VGRYLQRLLLRVLFSFTSSSEALIVMHGSSVVFSQRIDDYDDLQH